MSDPAAPQPKPKRSNPQLRVMSGVAMAIVALSLTWLGGPWFRAFAVAVMLLMFFEWSRMTRLERSPVHRGICWVGLGLIALAILAGKGEMVVFMVVLLAGLAALASGIVFGLGMAGAAGVAYSGLSGACLSFLRADDMAGLATILFLFAVVWGTDIFAYYVGRAVGGPKLAPAVSPGKTWSGAIGGALAAAILGILVGVATGTGWVFAAVASVILSAVSQLGDLAESAAKRRYGVKDSGFLIPGHGGVMDRVDGLVAGAMALYVINLLAGAAP